MPRLVELPELIGFFSYSRDDDEAFVGALSALRDGIQRELSAQLGRSKRDFRIWQDQQAIAPGTLWELEIKAAVAQSAFFIPIVTPRAVNSKYCGFEFSSFLDRERALGRSDLVFPILYISVAALEDEAIWRSHPVLSIIGQRQYIDWRPFRHQDIRAPGVREEIERFCSNIVAALSRPSLSPEERARADASAAETAAAESGRRAEEEAHRRGEIEERRRAAEETRRRADEEAARRHADEEAQRRAADEESRRRASEATPTLASLLRKIRFRPLLMSFEGRIGRGKFWLGTLICAFLVLLGETAGGFAAGLGLKNEYAVPLAVMFSGPGLIASIAVGIKRLHDRNKSGWWIVVLYFVPHAALFGWFGLSNLMGLAEHSSVHGQVFLAWVGMCIWALVELGCMRGTAGPNRFGEDPLASA